MKKIIELKTTLVIDKILNENSTYVKDLDIKVGDVIEISFKLTDYNFGAAHKVSVVNLRNNIRKDHCVVRNVYVALTKSFEFHEENNCLKQYDNEKSKA